MIQQTINVGAAPNDATGDPARVAFTKVNDNFGVLFSQAFFDTVADLEAATIPAACGIVYLWGYFAAGDGGCKTLKRSVSEPTHAGKHQSDDGAWWGYFVNGQIRIEQFGGKADWNGTTGTDNWQPLMDALSVVHYAPQDADYYTSGVIDFLEGGSYYFSQEIAPKRIFHLRGLGSGQDDRVGGTQFHFPADTHGIVIDSSDTLNGSTTAVTDNANGSTITGIKLVSAGGTDITKHAFWMRARANFIRCTAEGFPGNGFNIVGNNAGVAELRGNCNGWYMEKCLVKDTGNHGLYVQGNDANAGTCIALQVDEADGCGIKDISGLGSNTYVGSRIDGYGHNDQGRCTHAGQNYLLISDAVGIGSSTTPGTNDGVWYPLGVASGYTAWSALNTYSVSMPVYCSGASNRSIFIGTYTEGGTSHLAGPAISISGQCSFTDLSMSYFGIQTKARATFSGTGFGGYVVHSIGSVYGDSSWTAIGHDLRNGILQEDSQDGDGNFKWTRRWRGFDETFEVGSVSRVWSITGGATLETFGRASVVPRAFGVPWIAIGDPASPSTQTNARLLYNKAALPTSGEAARGEWIINRSPSAGGPPGWMCTTGGTWGSTAVGNAMANLVA